MKRGKDKKGLPFFGIPKLAPYLKPYKMLFFWMVVTGTVGSGMDAIIPLFQQHAIDHFIADKTMQGVGGWLALYRPRRTTFPPTALAKLNSISAAT